MSRGFIQIYTGDGKGKTTAALGLALRAAGRGRKVLFVQFLKGQESGEMYSLVRFPEIIHLKLGKSRSFFRDLSNTEQQELIEETCREWSLLKERIKQEPYDLVVLDEIMAVMSLGILSESMVLELLLSKSQTTEVVLTGRNVPEGIMAIADLVTEMKKVRHYYDQGVPSREGIEY